MTASHFQETVFLVDDDPSVLRAIGRLVRSAGWEVRTFSSPREFLAARLSDVPGCVVLDLTMPGMDGLELQRELGRRGFPLPVIFLTGNGDVPASVRAMKGGAVDFLGKPCRDDELIAAINAALQRNRKERGEREARRIVEERLAVLTPREHEVMLGVVAGQLNKQIAANLGTAEKTVKIHRGRVMDKLGVTSVAELVRLIERAGLKASR